MTEQALPEQLRAALEDALEARGGAVGLSQQGFDEIVDELGLEDSDVQPMVAYLVERGYRYD